MVAIEVYCIFILFLYLHKEFFGFNFNLFSLLDYFITLFINKSICILVISYTAING